MAGQNVVQAVAQRGSGIEAYVKGAAQWYSQLVPTHMDAGHYQALLLNVLRKNEKLMKAAEANPYSFRAAANECARLGLVPGVTGWFVPYENRRERTWDITLIVDWKGEIENIHKADPNVAAVETAVVRAGGKKPDYFRRPAPGRPLPEHEIQDDGLATAEERGPLMAVYAYCRYRDGSVSTCAVLTRDEVAKHRAKAKTTDFWGPEWPQETAWTERMWLKTGVHYLADRVPKSAEYQQNLIRTATLVAEHDQPTGAVIPAAAPARALTPGRRMLTGTLVDDETPAAGSDTIPGPGVPDAAREGNGTRADEPGSGPPASQAKENERGQATRAARAANSRGAQPSPPQDDPGPAGNSAPPPAGPDLRHPASRRDITKISTRLDDMPVGTAADVADVLTWLAGRPVTGPADLTQVEADRVWAGLNDVLARAGGEFGPAAQLLWAEITADISEPADG